MPMPTSGKANAAESVDTDGDNLGNNADTDDDSDGVLDVNDAFPLDATEFFGLGVGFTILEAVFHV